VGAICAGRYFLGALGRRMDGVILEFAIQMKKEPNQPLQPTRFARG
jgi:hypothetical protein